MYPNEPKAGSHGRGPSLARPCEGGIGPDFASASMRLLIGTRLGRISHHQCDRPDVHLGAVHLRLDVVLGLERRQAARLQNGRHLAFSSRRLRRVRLNGHDRPRYCAGVPAYCVDLARRDEEGKQVKGGAQWTL